MGERDVVIHQEALRDGGINPMRRAVDPSRGVRFVPIAVRAPRPAPRTSEEGWAAITAELATTPHLAYALLAEHKATEHGLCRACTRAGRGTPYLTWPCVISALARESIELDRTARPRDTDELAEHDPT